MSRRFPQRVSPAPRKPVARVQNNADEGNVGDAVTGGMTVNTVETRSPSNGLFDFGGFGGSAYSDDLEVIVKDEFTGGIMFVEEYQPMIVIYVKEFNETTAEDFVRLMGVATKNKHKYVVVKINSYGGEVYSLERMLNAMENAKKADVKVVTICDGIAMSCGAVLLAMGSKGYRYCGKHSVVLIHKISTRLGGNLDQIENTVSELFHDNKMLFRKMVRNANIGVPEKEALPDDFYNEILDILKADVHIHPARARLIKLVDHIGIPTFTRKVYLEYELVADKDVDEKHLEEEIKQDSAPVTVNTDVLNNIIKKLGINGKPATPLAASAAASKAGRKPGIY